MEFREPVSELDARFCSEGAKPTRWAEARTTGCNALGEGLDVVIEGETVPVRAEARLRRIAAAYESKYGGDWRFGVRDGAFVHEGARKGAVALVYEVTPTKAFGFRNGGEFSQTRWRFQPR